MKLNISRTAFRNAVALTAVALAGGKVTLPILANAKIVANTSGTTISTTDLNIWCRVTLPQPATHPGETTVPAKRLQSVSDSIEAQDIALESTDKHILNVVGGPSRFAIAGLPADEFPPDPTAQEPIAKLSVNSTILIGLLESVSRCQSSDETRKILNGVLFEVVEGEMLLVATDGRRLGTAASDVGTGHGIRITIPARGIAALSASLKKAIEGDVSVSIFNSVVQFDFASSIGPVSITTTLVEGDFPNWRQVLPLEAIYTATVDRDQLIAAVRRANLFTDEKFNSIRISFGTDTIEISSKSPDIGSANDPIQATITGSPSEYSVALNPEYLLDTISSVGGKHIVIGVVDENSPVAITCPGVDNWKHIIMPMRLS